jgi:hypothetical protein
MYDLPGGSVSLVQADELAGDKRVRSVRGDARGQRDRGAELGQVLGWTAPSEARPAPVPAPPAVNGDPGSGVSVPSAFRSNAAIVFVPAVLSSRYTCPTTGDQCADADAAAGTATTAPAATRPAAIESHRRDASKRPPPASPVVTTRAVRFLAGLAGRAARASRVLINSSTLSDGFRTLFTL